MDWITRLFASFDGQNFRGSTYRAMQFGSKPDLGATGAVRALPKLCFGNWSSLGERRSGSNRTFGARRVKVW